ncbi:MULTISPECIES: hypothetical protein [Gammaproteobacteria]|uniref:hypothetical protein n=1 Tax=Gammaproteobacteria TaxID=1236 RepID=UPI001C65F040|nr:MULTISPECIES: hypothetical protein [Gammaproteobacteria]MDS0025801.1 hypothetical protein [Enterobacter kobei]MDX7611865.1 hypothetical protein [Aeromonas caviae]QYK05579.1 hypothetical protein K0H63_01625 [Shewanella zhangzhouensis]
MAKLDKGTLALTFKFDCDRFLRFRLASDAERDSLGISAETYKRPGIELIKAAGRRWEADKYQDLIDTSDDGKVVFLLEDKVDDLLGRKPFKKIQNLFDILRQQEPPQAIIEAEFTVPTNITPGLQKAYDDFGLDQVRVRPDILWIHPGGTGAPLIGNGTVPEYEIHIIDVKMAAEPSLRHFTEVTYYALALATAIQQEGLGGRYAVSAEGTIWPGSHDINAFRNLVQLYQAKGAADPVSKALSETLIRVPYEVYEVHVKQFFEDRLLRVLQTDMEDASWHVGPKCQLCDYVRYCRDKASECDHLSRLAWLNQGQAELLRSNGITTTAGLTEAVTTADDRWQSVIDSSHQLRADGPALATRARSLTEGAPLLVDGRRSAMIPAWTDQSIFITIHFDPGSGISFALGAARLYFPHGRKPGDPPVTDEKIFIVDRVDAMNPETERERLKEFATVVSEWLDEVSTVNTGLPARDRLSSHIFFWDMLEMRQLKRMFERHMQNPDVIELIEILTRFFPPDSLLPDPDAFKSQPGTIVKEVLRMLVGLPVAHDYSLFDAANSFFPNVREDGTPYKFDLPFGFATPMSDQIPFERAYELWQDKIFVRHFNKLHPTDPSKWRRYTRDELYDGIKRATKVHLQALQHIVRRLRENYKDRLVLKKSGFSAARSSQASVPEAARSLIAFEKLNVACQEMENRNTRSMPVDEREARFFSIRGLTLKPQAEADPIIDEIKFANPQYQHETLYVFDFSPTSRDSRIKEGEFTVALSNENEYVDLDEPWRRRLGLGFQDAEELLGEHGLTERWMTNKSIGALLQVEVIRLEAMQDNPYVVLKPGHQVLFQFAVAQGLVALDSPLVLDPMYRDFSSDRIEKALRSVGGKAAPIKRARKRR